MRLFPFVRVAAFACAATLAAAAAPGRQSLSMKDDAPAEIEVANLTGESSEGVRAAEVRVSNLSGAALTYELTLGSSKDPSVARTLTVPANATRSLVLVAPAAGDTNWNYATVSARGPGTTGRAVSLASGSGVAGVVQVGISSRLESAYAGRWKAAINGVPPGAPSAANDIACVVAIDLASGPADRRVWRGLRSIVMTGDEWRAACAEPAKREALFGYVGQGGDIAIIAGKDTALPGIPAGKSDARFGFGEIRAYPGNADDAMRTCEATRASGPGAFGIPKAPPLPDDRPLERLLPAAARAGAGVVLIILLFATVVGPVNLFWLCRGARRHRMLWTTPLIALGFSGVIMAYVFVADGTGGEGYRRRVRLRPAGTTSEFLMQEQSSRTGLVIGSSFDVTEDVLMWPRADAAKVVYRSSGENAGMRRLDDTASGDWFRSRSVQTQYLEQWRSERGGVALTGPAGNPKLRSSVDGTLSKVFVHTASGAWRVAENVAPGATVETRAVAEPDFVVWYDGVAKTCSPAQLARLAKIRHAPGMWFAESPDLRAGSPETSASIRWKNLPDLLVGDLSPVAGAAE